MIEIPLNHDQIALVDDEDFERINQYHWGAQRAKGTWRAIAGKYPNGRKGKKVRYNLARMVMQVTDRKVKVSALNHNQLDCRKANLRIATHTEANRYQRKRKSPASSHYKGVSYNKQSGKWRAYIGVNKQMIWLGTYSTETEAAETYNQAAIKYFGEFAWLNEIPQTGYNTVTAMDSSN